MNREAEQTRVLSEETGGRRGTVPATVRAALHGAGRLVVVGTRIDRPQVLGPATVSIDDGPDAYTVSGTYADGTEIAVPADGNLHLEVNGGSVVVSGMCGTLVGDFNVGDVTIAARFDHGASTINANAGPVIVALDENSNVRVELRSACTSTVDPSIASTAPGQWTVGDGQATLTVTGNLGQFILRDAQHD